MRAVRFERHGGPEVLQVFEVDEPRPGAGELAVEVEAIAGSYVDTVMRRGDGPFGAGPLPGSPHGEVVGRVRAVGDGVDASLRGRRVAVLAEHDAYADIALGPAGQAALVPDGLDAAVATALAMAAPVAWIALELGAVAPGETVLVNAAAGSIGHLAVQLARHRGARVLATVGSPAKREFVSALGADAAFSTGDADWDAQVRAAAPSGVDLVVDSVGGEVATRSLASTPEFGRMVVFGAAGGRLPDVPGGLLLGLRTVRGFGVRQWRSARPTAARRMITELTGLLATGELRVHTTATFSLDEAVQAHAALEDRARTGRVLVRP